MKHMNRILGLCAAMALALCVGSAAAQQVEFNYNGRVRVGGQPFSGEGQFKFSLLTQDGEYTYWANDGVTLDGTEPTSVVTAQCTEGFFSVDIGDTSTTGMAALDASLFNITDHVFLRTWFSDGVHGFEVLQPDRRVVNPALLAQEAYEDVTIYVDGVNGNDKNSGLRPDKAKKTINGGIKLIPRRISSNVTIRIAPGLYREQVNIYGLSVNPEKKLKIIGDEEWTLASAGDPSVVVTGTDDDTTSTPARWAGILIQNCDGIEVTGIMATYCQNAGFRAYKSSSTKFYRCKAWKNPAGISFDHGSFGEIRECLAMGSIYGLSANLNSSVFLYNNKATQNTAHGVYGDFSYMFFDGIETTHNTYYGLSMTNTRASFRGTCVFSNNGQTGVGVAAHSSAFFGDGDYTGHIDNNGREGIWVQTQSYTYNHALNTFIGNPTAKIETGGAMY